MKDEIFNYQDNAITFESSKGQIMVKAAEMAKPFGKEPYSWLKLPSTKELIRTLREITTPYSSENEEIHTDPQKLRIDDNQLVITKKGGIDQGSWFHEDLALEFARWPSPAFALWCNAKIKELLTRGQTFIGSHEEDRKILEVIELLQKRTALQSEELKKQAPKVQYHDEILQSSSTYNTNQIAKEIGMSAVALNKRLHEKKVQYKQGDVWLLYHPYQNKGYTKTKTHVFTDEEGKIKSRMTTVWTEAGRKFIHNKLELNYVEV